MNLYRIQLNFCPLSICIKHECLRAHVVAKSLTNKNINIKGKDRTKMLKKDRNLCNVLVVVLAQHFLVVER
ncbi:hypothetical protein VNO77_18811 [Canavalia gladiata]|uniref:Uncharacterized protein n=1 Tax=Canavalia gladiata TaxID=3824 RepID=A0AAN9QJZ2_CANGL